MMQEEVKVFWNKVFEYQVRNTELYCIGKVVGLSNEKGQLKRENGLKVVRCCSEKFSQ